MARLCRDGGREGVKLQENASFSLPQSRCARQLPRQREPNETPSFAKEPISNKQTAPKNGAVRYGDEYGYLKTVRNLYRGYIKISNRFLTVYSGRNRNFSVF